MISPEYNQSFLDWGW